MHESSSLWFWLAGVAACVACTGLADESDEATAQAAGTGAISSAGASAAAGSGASGSAAEANAGTTGLPPTAGAGAEGPAGAGAAGATGASGGSSAAAGQAGTGDQWAHCGDRRRRPPSDCSPDATCEAIARGFPPCGSPASHFSADGCWRPDCRSDADCAPGERCMASSLVTGDCIPSTFDGCTLFRHECGCGWTADCGGYLMCVPEELVPPSQDCDLASVDCPSGERENSLALLLDAFGYELSEELRTSMEDCLAEVQAARAVCDPPP